ncbi:uncharacterized protein AMSG_04798 [Thecamonas trahens ATCC 50062]|uniref:FG-GAP repeat protein n=1 Tax=Thecamonas trahens ATCC 50062 TaxID=461836 RepID=A0A0L0DAM3_THETB|nr:hypothetical protein AMSG_04798 [Thecamonas trahens ATCC 50062]KNC48348.1 hypothetical protein AMSG_04798 [Thecamonas trahens ATCC 50062]|eukprot:XP_013758472.1 hypothetical protein AMSG_04798 [Thecamonas trahens ATCC 50062]
MTWVAMTAAAIVLVGLAQLAASCGTGQVVFDEIVDWDNTTVAYPTASRSGTSVALIGDVDGDGTGDAAFGSPLADLSDGSVTIVMLNQDGSANSTSVLSKATSALTTMLSTQAGQFGTSVGGAGDLNGDSVPDLLVGAPVLGATGKVIIIFLTTDAGVSSVTTIENGVGLGLTTLVAGELFGSGLATIKGVSTINYATHALVGIGLASGQDRITTQIYGSILIATLSRVDGSVTAFTLFDHSQSGMAPVTLGSGFGSAIAAGDVRGTGSPLLAVGAPLYDSARGRVFLVDMDWTLMAITGMTIVEEGALGWTPTPALGSLSQIGTGVMLADINADGCVDLALGAPGAEEIGPNYGMLAVLLLNSGPSSIAVEAFTRISYSANPALQSAVTSTVRDVRI